MVVVVEAGGSAEEEEDAAVAVFVLAVSGEEEGPFQKPNVSNNPKGNSVQTTRVRSTYRLCPTYRTFCS